MTVDHDKNIFFATADQIADMAGRIAAMREKIERELGSQIHGYDTKLGDEATLPLPEGDIQDFRFSGKRFFFRLKDTVLVCRQTE